MLAGKIQYIKTVHGKGSKSIAPMQQRQVKYREIKIIIKLTQESKSQLHIFSTRTSCIAQEWEEQRTPKGHNSCHTVMYILSVGAWRG